jgi:septal ring-binding cell division protein DamX
MTLRQAQQYANETGKAEKVSLSVVKDKKFYRVIAGAFSDKEAANAKIKELHKHSAFAEAWAFHKPQK